MAQIFTPIHSPPLFKIQCIRPTKDIDEKELREVNICIEEFNDILAELHFFFTRDFTKEESALIEFDVAEGSDCLQTYVLEQNKINTLLYKWVQNMNTFPSKSFSVGANIDQPNGIFLSNRVSILEKIPNESTYKEYTGIVYKQHTTIIDTRFGTGFEDTFCEYINKRFQLDLLNKQINVDMIYRSKDYEIFKLFDDVCDYKIYQFAFCNYKKSRLVYYLTVDDNNTFINEGILCTDYGKIRIKSDLI